MEGLRHRIAELGRSAGLDRVGFASPDPFPEVATEMARRRDSGESADLGFTYVNPAIATTPRQSFAWAATLVVGARAYLPEAGSPDNETGDGGTGRVARVAIGDRYRALRVSLQEIADALHGEGFRAEVLCDDNRLVDRAAAVRAGIGWWGKNTMVLIPGLGPWAVLGSVVTDAHLEPDPPLSRDCGSCSACLPACPTGALVAPGVLDARRCLAAWAQRPGLVPIEFRQAMGDRLYGCDDCLVACPPGGKLLRRSHQPAGRFDLGEVLHASDETLIAWFGHWFLPDRNPGIIRRNALIAAGNSGAETLVDEVALYAAHPNWMLRTHAVWSLRRLGGSAATAVLRQRHGVESDSRVRAELD
ncbi:MAG: tRNA epoxyqueuosine(34) reductase QueG [Acidimicrobiia bacterium]